jgi:hypothetical protein
MRCFISVNKALSDAKLKYTDVQQAAVGYLYGGTCSGQRALYDVGMTGIPIYNVRFVDSRIICDPVNKFEINIPGY